MYRSAQNTFSSVTNIYPSIHRDFISIYEYPSPPFTVFPSQFAVILTPFMAFPPLFTLFPSPFTVFSHLFTLLIPPFIDILPSSPSFRVTYCYFSLKQSITTLLKPSTTQCIFHLFPCIFFLLQSIISITENFPIPSVPLCQVFIFTLTITLPDYFPTKYLLYQNQITSPL